MRTALIIEDDPDANDLLADIVREAGLEPVQVLTGEQGLTHARSKRPDVVFLDLMLPDVDGYKICESLKIDRETNPISVVMVTALSADDNRLRGFRVGADAYVAKPYTPQEIHTSLDLVRQRLGRMQESIEHAIAIDLSSEIESLQSVNELFGLLFRQTPLADGHVRGLRNAIQELGTNAIEWGNRFDDEKIVRMACHIHLDRVEIRIEDEGEGFDPRNLPHASSGDEDPTRHFAIRETLGLREGGFGILIAKGLADEVSYNDRGNVVTLVKRFEESIE